jgi:hypothetical protein
MTEEQYAPSAAHALMSAWMPAPAPESEPATVRTCGHGIARAATASLRGRVVGEGETRGEEVGEGNRTVAAVEGRCGARAAAGGCTDAIGKWREGL